MGNIPNYNDVVLDLLHLGMWRAEYANDPAGELSPFGPALSDLGRVMEGKPIGVLHSLTQQISDPFKENLIKAQGLAVDIYDHFLRFLEENGIDELKPDYPHAPLIQLYGGGAVTWFKDFPIPTIIAMQRSKAGAFSGMSALPHEIGHDISGTFNGAQLVEQISSQVQTLGIPHTDFWKDWTEECFADAIGVSIIREGEIYSLANLFSGYYTNIIFADENEPKPDEHPNRHIRVLLAIEAGRILGVDSSLLDQMKTEWEAFGRTRNTEVDPDKIFDVYNQRFYPMSAFVEGVKPVAEALVDTPYPRVGGKKIRDLFAGFTSDLAEEMRLSITEKKWKEQIS